MQIDDITDILRAELNGGVAEIVCKASEGEWVGV